MTRLFLTTRRKWKSLLGSQNWANLVVLLGTPRVKELIMMNDKTLSSV